MKRPFNQSPSNSYRPSSSPTKFNISQKTHRHNSSVSATTTARNPQKNKRKISSNSSSSSSRISHKSRRPSHHRNQTESGDTSHLNSFLQTLNSFSSHSTKNKFTTPPKKRPSVTNNRDSPPFVSGNSVTRAPASPDNLFQNAYRHFQRKNYSKALHLFEIFIQNNEKHKFAYYYCGYIYLTVEKEYSAALAYMKRALKLGHVPAAYYLGKMYFEGLGIPQNSEIALAYFEYAAKREHAAAMLNTAILKSRIAHTEADLCVAKEWLSKAAMTDSSMLPKKKLHAYFQVIEGLRALKHIRSSLKEPKFLKRPTDNQVKSITFETDKLLEQSHKYHHYDETIEEKKNDSKESSNRSSSRKPKKPILPPVEDWEAFE